MIITISGTPIEFPESGTSPDWAEAVDQFAQLTAAALLGLAGAFDVPPQILNIDAQNPTSTNVDIPNLAFSTTSVRAAYISITTYRNTTTTTLSEVDTIMVVYNADNSIGQKWEMIRSYGGNGQITFNITDAGQVQFITTTVGGSNHIGILSYSARALLNT